MEENVYQTVFDKVVDFLPDGWKKMVFFAGYTNGSYTMKFYSENCNKEYKDCFNMPGVSKASLVKLFMEIDKVLSAHRKKLGNDKAWMVFTMSVNSDGCMKTDFDYDNHSDDMVAFEEIWKAKYLV